MNNLNTKRLSEFQYDKSHVRQGINKGSNPELQTNYTCHTFSEKKTKRRFDRVLCLAALEMNTQKES